MSRDSALQGRRAAVLLFSYYPSDPRPRRAAEALVGAGMRVELICLRQSTHEPTREVFNGVEVLRLPLKRRRSGPSAYLLQYSAFIAGAFAVLAVRSMTRRYALVHVHNMPDVLVFAALVPKALGARVILDLHDPMPELMMTIFGLRADHPAVRLLKRLERVSIAFADAVFTVNLACKRLFVSRSCEAEKVRVIMNAPDEEIFSLRTVERPPVHGREPFVLMYHGLIAERNGLDLAVRALGLVRERVPAAELRIYGDATPFLSVVMDTARTLGVHEAVRYFGRKGLEDIVAAIDDCDVGIIPNRRTIFTEINTPTRIFEYVSRGKPVMTGRAPGIQDYFGADGLLYFDLGDAADLAGRIIDLFSRPDAAAEATKRAQSVYLAHCWSEERQRLLETVAELLAPSRLTSGA